MKTTDAAGFTTLEAIVAILVVSIAGAALFAGVFTALRGMEKEKRTIIDASLILKTDRAIRDAVGKVRIPFWERDTAITITDDEANIPRYEGKRDCFLHIKWIDSKLSIQTQEKDEVLSTVNLTGLDDVSIELLTDTSTDKSPVGLDISWYIHDREYHTIAAFASAPLENEQ